MEVADVAFDQNIEMDNGNKYLILKPVKRRDIENNTDVTITAIAHPFISANSFGLRHDINENCSISIPLYTGPKNVNNLVAANI